MLRRGESPEGSRQTEVDSHNFKVLGNPAERLLTYTLIPLASGNLFIHCSQFASLSSHERASQRHSEPSTVLEEAEDCQSPTRLDDVDSGVAPHGYRVHAILLLCATRFREKHAGMHSCTRVIRHGSDWRGS